MTGDAAIRTDGLTKSYGARTVLDRRRPGGRPRRRCCALLGPNGAGKTTTVRILATLVSRRTRGTATVAGHDVVRDAGRVRRAISLTGQYAAVDEVLTGGGEPADDRPAAAPRPGRGAPPGRRAAGPVRPDRRRATAG